MQSPLGDLSWGRIALIAGASAVGTLCFALRKRLLKYAEQPTAFDVRGDLIEQLHTDLQVFRKDNEQLRAELKQAWSELATARAELQVARQDIARLEQRLDLLHERHEGRDHQ